MRPIRLGASPWQTAVQNRKKRRGFGAKAPGIEADLGQLEITMEHQSGTISTDADPADVPNRARKCAIVRGVVTESSAAYELSNVVETALARALVLAAEAKRWDIVMRIADELERRGRSWPAARHEEPLPRGTKLESGLRRK